MWSRKFDCCRICGSTENKHVGKGLCTRCYHQQYQVQHAEKLAKYKQSWYLKNHDMRLSERKLAREARHFSGLRDSVLEHDQYKCCRCHTTTTLVVHHIDGNGRGCEQPNNTMDNLQTLCRKCHFLCHNHPAQFTCPPAPKLNKQGKWNNKYDACICCGTVYSAHTAKGLCNACYCRKKAKGELVVTPRQLTNTPKLAGNGKWSQKHDACVCCHKNTSKHVSHGLCNRCYLQNNKKK